MVLGGCRSFLLLVTTGYETTVGTKQLVRTACPMLSKNYAFFRHA